MGEKFYNQLLREVQKFHEGPSALVSAYERVMGVEDVEVWKGFSRCILLNFRPWVVSFPRWLGHIYGNCPDPEVRRVILEDMEDEDKKDPHPLARDGHVGLHRRLLVALGVGEEEMEDWDRYPAELLGVVHSFFEFARVYPWQEGMAAVMSSELTNVRDLPKIYPDQVELGGARSAGAALMWAVLKRLVMEGVLKKEDVAFLFAHDWTLLDELEGKPVDRARGTEVKHAVYVLRALVEHTPPERQPSVLSAFRTGLRLFRTYFEVMGREGHAFLDRAGVPR
jgi:hypothetical protein